MGLSIKFSATQAKLIHTAVMAFASGATAYWGLGQPLTKATLLGLFSAGVTKVAGVLLSPSKAS